MSETKEVPKKLRRTLERLEKDGEEPIHFFPAIPRRYMNEKTVAMARIGMIDELNINSWVVVTTKNLIFVRGGLLRNREDKIPLSDISDLEYVKEFHDNTIKIKIGEAAEDVRFHDEIDGVTFFKYIKYKGWENH